MATVHALLLVRPADLPLCHPVSQGPRSLPGLLQRVPGPGGRPQGKDEPQLQVQKRHDRFRLSGWALTLILPGTGIFSSARPWRGRSSFRLLAEIGAIMPTRCAFVRPALPGGTSGGVLLLAAVHFLVLIAAALTYRSRAENGIAMALTEACATSGSPRSSSSSATRKRAAPHRQGQDRRWRSSSTRATSSP